MGPAWPLFGGSVMKKSRMMKMEEKIGYLFIAPFLLMFIIFKLYPMIYGFVVSFWDRNSEMKLLDTTFVGFSNYITVLRSRSFWEAFGHSIVFSVIYVSFLMVFGFLCAVLLNKEFKGRTIVRTCFYIPYVTNMIAVGIVFKYLLNPTRGPINAIFRLFDFSGPKWFSSPVLALPTAAIVAAWAALAFNIITCLAAMQEIPKDVYEVADIEGATFFQKVRYIILPYLMPTLFMLLTITLINSFRNYTAIVGLTGGGPGTSSKVVSLLIYDDAFNFLKFSIASAEGVIFTIFIIILNTFFTRVRKAWENR